MPVALYVGGAAAIATLSVLITLLATGSLLIDVRVEFKNSSMSQLSPDKKWDAFLHSQSPGTPAAQFTDSINDTMELGSQMTAQPGRFAPTNQGSGLPSMKERHRNSTSFAREVIKWSYYRLGDILRLWLTAIEKWDGSGPFPLQCRSRKTCNPFVCRT